jgi:two-component system response regulator DesR
VTKILVAEPISLIREGIVAVLSREQDLRIVAAVRQGQEVIPAARASEPHVALLAATFPGYEGITLARGIHAARPECRCAILSVGRRVRDLRLAVSAHVDGFLVQDCPTEFLIEAVRQLAAGNKVIDPGLTFSVLDHGSSPFTAREAEALRAAAVGSTTAEIAATLSLAEGTVRNYLSRAIAKTGARNRVGAIRVADEHGWL